MPLLVAADVQGHKIILADPFNGIATDIGEPGSAVIPAGKTEARLQSVVNAPLFALNLQLTPGVYDFTNGQTLVAPSTGKSPKPAIGSSMISGAGALNAEAVIDPMSVVPATIQAAAASPGGGDISPVPVVGWLAAGDHIVGAGAVGAVVDAMRQPLPAGTAVTTTTGAAKAPGKGKVELQVFSLQAAFPHSTQPRQRVFRFINGADGFPGVSLSYITFWRSRMGHKGKQPEVPNHDLRLPVSKDVDEDGNDDASRLIKALRSEAETMFAGPQTAGANLAALSSLLAYELPGTVTVEHGSTLLTTSADLAPLLRPGDVIRVGNNGPLVIAEIPAIPSPGSVPPSGAGFLVRLDASFAGESLKAARLFVMPDVTALPGTVTLDPSGSSLATTDSWRMRVLPNELLLIAGNPLLFVTVAAAPPTTKSDATGVSLAQQHEMPAGYPVTDLSVVTSPPFTVAKDAVTAGLRAFRTGIYAALAPAGKAGTSSSSAGGDGGATVGSDGKPSFRQRGLAAPARNHAVPKGYSGEGMEIGAPASVRGRMHGHNGRATGAGASGFVHGNTHQRQQRSQYNNNGGQHFSLLEVATGASATVTEGTGDSLAACVVDVENGSNEVLVSGCDPRSLLKARDEIFIGKPQEWACNGAPAGLGGAGAASAGAGGAAAGGSAPAAAGSEAPARSCLCPYPFVIAAPTPSSTGATSESVTATSIQLATPYTGTTARGLPLYRTGAAQLPGTVRLNPGETIVPVADGDPRPYLQSGDLIELRGPAVAGKPQGALAAATSDAGITWFPRMVVGGAGIVILGGQGSAESAATAAAVAANDVRQTTTIGGPAGVAAGPLLGVSARDFYITEPYNGAAAVTGLTVRRLPMRMLPGRLALSPGAVVSYTSKDLREYLTPNRRIFVPAIHAYLTVARPLATSSSSGPAPMPGGSGSSGNSGPGASITQSRLTLRDAIASNLLDGISSTGAGSVGGGAAGANAAGLPLSTVSKCPTLPVISPYGIVASGGGSGPLAGARATGPIVSVVTRVKAIEGNCVQGQPATDARVWVAAFADTSETMSADVPNLLDELASRQLPGTVSVIAGSAIISSTMDLSTYLATGDIIRLGSAPQTYTVAAQPATGAFRITAPYGGPTASGLPLFQQYRRLRLSATIDVQYGNPTAVTHGDLRKEVASGDWIQVVSRITGRVLLREYIVLPPFNANSLTLSEAYAGATESGCTVFRLVGGSGAGVLLPGTVAATEGSTIVATTEDLSGALRAGDHVRITTIEVIVAEPVTTRSFAIQEPYTGTTGTGFRAFNLGRTRAQMTLEQLARLKLQCRSIYCLAKIEEMERAIPSDVSRSLNAGALLGGVEPPKADSASGMREDVLAQQAAAEAAVEREWQQWYDKAKSQLGISNGGAPRMTQAEAEAFATSGGSGGAAAKAPA